MALTDYDYPLWPGPLPDGVPEGHHTIHGCWAFVNGRAYRVESRYSKFGGGEPKAATPEEQELPLPNEFNVKGTNLSDWYHSERFVEGFNQVLNVVKAMQLRIADLETQVGELQASLEQTDAVLRAY